MDDDDLISGLPADYFSSFYRQFHHASRFKTSYIIIKHNAIEVANYIFSTSEIFITAAFSISPHYTFIEFESANYQRVNDFILRNFQIYQHCPPIQSIQVSFIHVLMWRPYTIKENRSFGYISAIPYIQRPCEILDISCSGGALLAVLPDPKQPHPLLPEKMNSTFKIGFCPSSPLLECIHHQGLFHFKMFHLIETQIEFLYFTRYVPETTVNKFLTEIPLVKENIQFSFMEEMYFLPE
jgi:hypothetical protein